jgi:hypothetical protein
VIFVRRYFSRLFWFVYEQCKNNIDRENRIPGSKTISSVILSTASPTCNEPSSKTGLRGQWPATNQPPEPWHGPRGVQFTWVSFKKLILTSQRTHHILYSSGPFGGVSVNSHYVLRLLCGAQKLAVWPGAVFDCQCSVTESTLRFRSRTKKLHLCFVTGFVFHSGKRFSPEINR